MRLKQFRIKNFRSIVDTGWNQMATDNVTGLIGQNESGKTTILEALKGFYDGAIIDDILRSDLSLPEVSCSFEISPKKFRKLLSEKIIPEQVLKLIEESGMITITRSWTRDKSSYLGFGDERVTKYYRELESKKKEFQQRAESDMNRIISDAKKAEEELNRTVKEKNQLQQELSLLESKIAKAKKKLKRTSVPENQNRLEKLNLEHEQLKKRIERKARLHNTKSEKAADLREKARYAQLCMDDQEQLQKLRNDWEGSYKKMSELQRYYEILTSTGQKRKFKNRLDLANGRYLDNTIRLEQARENAIFRLYVTARILKGADHEEAMEAIEKEFDKANKYYTDSELANESFKHIPVFELFEDFSSLLPNKIDMDDIFTENTSVEGYKAARNFLLVAGLDEKFFEEQNSRILKQKIEKLNNEITLDFQDYWQQNLGRENKIEINFELEHYDLNYPEKVGKPYLEFWIKDNLERLYPKQRSRGVRWFLSFYLELKASAIENRDRSRIFLIDEPGLSLHARAQEDVLKVFEDIKEDIQIIYTTHSPHLININKLYRLLAVQRAVEDDYTSETVIYDARSLNEASTDTLSPIYTLMGTKITDHQFIKKKNNVIVEDTTTYYYLNIIYKLVDYKKDIHFLPATDVHNVPTLVNLLLGWKLDFLVLLDDDQEGNKVYSNLKLTLFGDDESKAGKQLILLRNVGSIEDLFSTLDFKNFILRKRIGITEANSEYIANNNLARQILASDFMLHIQNNNIKFEDFDEETQGNMQDLVSRIDALLS